MLYDLNTNLHMLRKAVPGIIIKSFCSVCLKEIIFTRLGIIETAFL